jgi:DNA-binding MltR family transcriptional regulator
MTEMADFLNEFINETDRAAAVLGGVYLESRLEELLRTKFVAMPELVEDLFKRQGALSSFSAKISIAYAVGLISLRSAEDLHSVRRIRNAFAHQLHGLSFKNDKIIRLVDSLNFLNAVRDQEGNPIRLEEPRQRFNMAVALLLLKAIETRIRDMPKFQEAIGGTEIIAERF